jgi:hypothetical protein
MRGVFTEAFSDEREIAELGEEPAGTSLVIIHVSFEVFDDFWQVILIGSSLTNANIEGSQELEYF